MIYFKDYPGFICNSENVNNRFHVWHSTFSDDFVYVILGRITTSIYGDSEIYETLEDAMDAIKHKAMINFFDEN